MRKLTYEDGKGRKFLVEVPDNAPESHAKMGVRIGPPDLAALALPLATEVRLNNALFTRGLFTKGDLHGRRTEMFAALQAAYRADVQVLDTLYEGAT